MHVEESNGGIDFWVSWKSISKWRFEVERESSNSRWFCFIIFVRDSGKH